MTARTPFGFRDWRHAFGIYLIEVLIFLAFVALLPGCKSSPFGGSTYANAVKPGSTQHTRDTSRDAQVSQSAIVIPATIIPPTVTHEVGIDPEVLRFVLNSKFDPTGIAAILQASKTYHEVYHVGIVNKGEIQTQKPLAGASHTVSTITNKQPENPKAAAVTAIDKDGSTKSTTPAAGEPVAGEPQQSDSSVVAGLLHPAVWVGLLFIVLGTVGLAFDGVIQAYLPFLVPNRSCWIVIGVGAALIAYSVIAVQVPWWVYVVAVVIAIVVFIIEYEKNPGFRTKIKSIEASVGLGVLSPAVSSPPAPTPQPAVESVTPSKPA